jgi:hypothetical protein
MVMLVIKDREESIHGGVDHVSSCFVQHAAPSVDQEWLIVTFLINVLYRWLFLCEQQVG